MRRLPALAVLAATACGGGGSGTPPDTAIPVDAFPTAPHAPYPQLPDQGGPRLTQPQLVTVTFANDARAPMLEAFATWIVGSNWLTAVGAEYGIQHGGVAGVAHRPETPPATMTSADIEAYLAAGVADGSIPKPASLADALYLVYYPSTTAITTTFVNGIIKKSCVDFGGYHGEVHSGGQSFAYAAIATCAGVVPGLSALETTELIVSHEVIEAATDAMPITMPAYQLRADPSDPWATAFEFEVEDGDLCEAPSRFVREAGFVAQRAWSNAAAAAGGEPCVPIDPALPAYGVTATPTVPPHAPVGATVDFTLAGWSTGPVADWRLSAEIFGAQGSLATRPRVTFSAPMINNGGSAVAHVVMPAVAASGSTIGIVIVSQHKPDGSDATMWPVAIVVQ